MNKAMPSCYNKFFFYTFEHKKKSSTISTKQLNTEGLKYTFNIRASIEGNVFIISQLSLKIRQLWTHTQKPLRALNTTH